MRPDDPQMKNTSIFVPQRPHTLQVSSSQVVRPSAQSQLATADLARKQIASIYGTDPNSNMEVADEPTPMEPSANTTDGQIDQAPAAQIITDRHDQYADAHNTQATTSSSDPFERSHDDTVLQTSNEDWKKYHSAWQQYYQEYFNRYYTGYLEQTRSAYAKQSERLQELEAKANEITPEEAMDDLRSKLRARVKSSAKKVRHSRHFMPIIAGLTVMVILLFLQYNRIIMGYAYAYLNPGSLSESAIIVDPTTSTAVSEDPVLIIPKINVDVKVIYDDTMGNTQQETYDKQMAAMAKGVAWFGITGANSHPGQRGNTVLAGHASNDWYDFGDVKFIFANLTRMTNGDTVYVNYKGTRYTYVVTGTKVVMPDDLNALRVGTDKPMLTLLTCTPLGTSQKRLLVFAEQVSPDPSSASAAPATTNDNSSTDEIPGVKSKILGVF